MKKILLIASMFVLGCSSDFGWKLSHVPSSRGYAPERNPEYHVWCSEDDMNYCANSEKYLCPSGYVIVERRANGSRIHHFVTCK